MSQRCLVSALAVVLLGSLVLLGAHVAEADEAKARAKLEAKSKRFFEQYDADEDGRLSKAEYPAWLRGFFDRIDADGDGFVSREEDVAARVAMRQARSAGKNRRRVPEGVTAHRGLPYAQVDGQKLLLDLFLPKDVSTKPALFVWIHGGGWTKGSRQGVNPMVLRLVGDGYAAASIDYRLEGLASHPKQIHDCKGAIRWLRAKAAEYGYDPDRVAVGGGSAGGHLSLLVGLSANVEALEGTVGGNADERTDVRAVVDLYGPSDLLLFRGTKARFGRGMSDATLKEASPLTHLTADDPPVLILHGDQDPLVPLSQSRAVKTRYDAAGLPCTLHVIEGAGHGGKPFSDDVRYELTKAFLDRHTKPRTATTPAKEP